MVSVMFFFFFFQAEDGIRDLVRSRGLGDVYKRQDLDQGGRSVLGIRPLLWKNGWPVAGDNFKEGTYEIESERRGYALELVVDFVRMAGGMRGFGRGTDEPVKPVPSQELADVINTWPGGNIAVRNGEYMSRPFQNW